MSIKFSTTSVLLIVLATIAACVLVFHFDVFGMYEEEMMDDELAPEVEPSNLYHY